MLLWLTLALLWSSTCWADETFGPGGGTYFMISKNNEDELTGIRVFIGPVGLIKSIQVRYGSSWSEKYGIPGGKSYELLLQPGEHITRIFGRYRKFIQCLTMYTSRGNKTSFGKEIGKGFFAAASQNRKVLIGVYGQYRLYGLTSIGFLWDYPRGGMTSAQHKSVSSEE